MAPVETFSPEWWVVRLYKRLMERKRWVDYYSRYYIGQFDYPWLPQEIEEEFKSIMEMTRSNYMGLVVDAMVERMNLVGFRRADTKDGSADKDIWNIWQYNNLDTYHDQGLLEAAIGGCFYYHVAMNKDDSSLPYAWIEHPAQVIVEHTPGTNRRDTKAGIKAWVDDWTGGTFVNLFLDDGRVYKFFAKNPKDALIGDNGISTERELTELSKQWERYTPSSEVWAAKTGIEGVPLIESPNNPRLLTGGRSELIDVTVIQDRISKTIADRLVTQDYGAFPQRLISGWPEEDESGTPQDPIETGRKRILTTDVAEARADQFDAAPLDPYSAAKREDVKDIASRTRTPAHYLLGEMANVNSETLKASETGLVAKCKQRMSGHNEPAEAFARKALLAAGKKVDPKDKIEVIWDDPESRTQAEKTDALIKMKQAADLPRIVVWEKWGATPTEIERWTKLREKEQEEALQMDPAMAVAESYRRNVVGGAQPGGGSDEDIKGTARDPQVLTKPNGVTK